MKKNVRVEVFHSFEDENRADTRRRAGMSYAERLREFEVLQQRAWGENWTSKPMKKVATWEILDW